MGRYSPYYSPPRRGYGGRGRSPPRGRYGGYREQGSGSLLVRNIPMDCRPEDLRIPFEHYGPIRDVYLPRDYYTGEPRGFGFVEYVDAMDASEAVYHMNGEIVCGRRVAVVLAAETRKRPEQMRNRGRQRGGHDRRRSSYYGHSRSRSRSRSRSPRDHSPYRSRYRSRSYSPAPRRRRSDYSTSPGRRDEHPRSPIDRDRSVSPSRRSRSPKYGARDHSPTGNGHDERLSYDARRGDDQSPGRESGSPRRTHGRESGSPRRTRSRSADVSPSPSRH